MPAYVVALIGTISDPQAYAGYVAEVEATLAPFGGRFLARKPDPAVLEGEWAPARAVILSFPGEKEARDWYHSPRYRPLLERRRAASRATLLLLPSYAAGSGPSLHDVCYVEVVTPAVGEAVRVCEAAYGWTFGAPDAHLGSARVAELANGGRFAIRAPLDPAEQPLTRSYVRVPDIGAAVARAQKAGAEVLLPSMELGPYGTIAIWRMGGVEHGAWQMA